MGICHITVVPVSVPQRQRACRNWNNSTTVYSTSWPAATAISFLLNNNYSIIFLIACRCWLAKNQFRFSTLRQVLACGYYSNYNLLSAAWACTAWACMICMCLTWQYAGWKATVCTAWAFAVYTAWGCTAWTCTTWACIKCYFSSAGKKNWCEYKKKETQFFPIICCWIIFQKSKNSD